MRSGWVKAALAAGALCLAVPVWMSAAVMSSIVGSLRPAAGLQCRAPALSVSNPAGGMWSAEQRANAAAIVQAGAALQVPPRGWVIAVATAMQESSLQNLGHGDSAGPDSRGLFQQRTSWGPESVRMDPTGAAGLFYARLTALPNWETRSLASAAQAVQISAIPDAYAKWEDEAQALVTELTEGQGLDQVWCQNGGGSTDGWALPLARDLIIPPMRPHHSYPAVDIGVPPGQPVYAMRGGTVREVNDPARCGYGLAVTDQDGAEWIYCHASRLTVLAGTVAAGQELMLSGGQPGTPGAGSSTGAHLHVQVTIGGSRRCVGVAVDALAAGQSPPPVAQLPTSGCVG